MPSRSRLPALLLGLCLTHLAAAAEPASLADFFRNPDFDSVQISRDGRYLSTITRTDAYPAARNIVVMEIGQWDEARLVTAYEEEIRWHTWLADGRLVFKVDRAYEDPGKTTEYVGFYTVRHDGKQGRALHEPFRRDSRRGRGTSAANMATTAGGVRETLQMIDVLPGQPDHVLVEVSEGVTWFQDAARLDLGSGRVEPAGDARGSVERWFADNQGRVRAAIDRGEERDDLIDHLIYRETGDDEWRTIMEFHYYDYRAHGFDADGRHLWLSSRVDRDQAALFRVDLEAGSLRHVVSRRPWIDPRRMREMRPVSFEARDGLTIHDYLTLPAADEADGCEAPCRWPLIVHPHGGPYDVRDNWGFGDEVQFLASRGYAVLQVNYRGSGGYGREFLGAGFKRWGLEMQDDLTDAVQWAIEQGYADPGRIGIYGASYGGYATMMGLVKTPALYRVGISYVGVVDLLALHRQDTRRDRPTVGGLSEWLGNWREEHVGDPGRDGDRLRETSPLYGVDRIDAPVLVIHGQADPRVEYDYQYQPLIRALRRHDKTHETLVKRHEGHGFYREQNHIELYGRIERFLGAHMPAGPATGTRTGATH